MAQTLGRFFEPLYVKEHQHEPEYSNCPQTKESLRAQDLVKEYERAAVASEPERLMEAHVIKAKGSLNDTYTTAELIQLSLWNLRAFGPQALQIHTGIRDRAMLLCATTIAFCGNSSRMALLSDIYFKHLPMGCIGPGITLQTLVIMSNQSKTNTTGRVEDHGIFRHSIPELCAFGGLGWYFFSAYHIVGKKPPNFVPDFEDTKHSEYGRHDWYRQYLFPGKAKPSVPDGATQMSYDNHYERVSTMHERNNISISAVTHAGRRYTAATSRDYGASTEDAKALGRWKSGDAFQDTYDRALPKFAMLAAAMFSSEHPETHVLPRGLLEPPKENCAVIFPWVESEMAAYEDRLQKHGRMAVDIALKNLLTLLSELRSIIVQDAAALFPKYPDLPLWKYPPFDSITFRRFSASASAIMQNAEIEARHRLETLPSVLAQSMNGMMQTVAIKQEEMAMKLEQDRQQALAEQRFVQALIVSYLQHGTKARSKVPDIDNILSTLSTGQNDKSFGLTSPINTPIDPNFPIDPVLLKESAEVGSSSLIKSSPSNSDQASSLWPDDLVNFQSSFVLSALESQEYYDQIDAIRQLVTRFGSDKVGAHQFEWVIYSAGPINKEWLPVYHHQKGLSLDEMWKEWTVGLNGCLSIQQLNDGWQARWRRNNQTQKTEASRRKHLYDLVTELCGKFQWTNDKALKFLEVTFPIPGPAYRILEPTKQQITLTELAIEYGWDKANTQNVMRIGIDISTMVNECIAAEHGSHLYRYRTNGPMRTMLFKFCALLREAPIVPIFVFDGPLRPEWKHGKKIDTETVPEWMAECKTLIHAFGFYSHDAPGEADAELSMLNATHCIDFILTSDSDTLAFGGQRILRKCKNSNEYSLYTCDRIRDKYTNMEYYTSAGARRVRGGAQPTNSVSDVRPQPLDRGGFILIALLSGNDYGTGLIGCGIQTATSLAGAGYGTQILEAFNTLMGSELDAKLKNITLSIADELQHNRLGLLSQRNKVLANKLRDAGDIITAKNVCAFASPVASTNDGSTSTPVWSTKLPSVELIAQYCMGAFHWTNLRLKDELSGVLWPGVLLRMITSRYLTWDNLGPENMCVTVGATAEIHRVAVTTRGGKMKGKWAHIQFSTNDLLRRLGISGIPPTVAHGYEHTNLTWIRVEFVPDFILDMANNPETRLSSRQHPKKHTHSTTPAEKRSTREDFDSALRQLEEMRHRDQLEATSSSLKRKHSEAF